MEHTMSDVLRVTTEGYLDSLDRDNPPSPAVITVTTFLLLLAHFTFLPAAFFTFN